MANIVKNIFFFLIRILIPDKLLRKVTKIHVIWMSYYKVPGEKLTANFLTLYRFSWKNN